MVLHNHEIIHINNKEKNEVVFTKDIGARIGGIGVKAKVLEFGISFLVPDSRRLAHAIDGALEATNEGFGTREYIARGLMEVDNLQEFAVEEGALWLSGGKEAMRGERQETYATASWTISRRERRFRCSQCRIVGGRRVQQGEPCTWVQHQGIRF